MNSRLASPARPGALVATWVLLLGAIQVAAASSWNASVFIESPDRDARIELGHRAGANAWAEFSDTYNQTGWGVIAVRTADGGDPFVNAYAAGYAEGWMTQEMVFQHVANTLYENLPHGPSPRLRSFVERNWHWTKDEAQRRASRSVYWANVLVVLSQFEGLVRGYADRAPAEQQLSFEDLLYTTMDGDIPSLVGFFQMDPNITLVAEEGGEDGEVLLSWQEGDELLLPLDAPPLPRDFRCSSLVKLLPDHSRLFFSHSTWDSFMAMVRLYKHYSIHIPVDQDPVTGKLRYERRLTSLSSSPAFLASVDDWYLSDLGLAVMETTNGIYNAALLKHVHAEGQVMSWIRTIVANNLASTGAEWARVFSAYNSGTYNNQWIVVDTKRFSPGSPPAPGTLTILEQMPGRVVWADKTEHLVRHLHWPSYNVPFFPEVYRASGFAAMARRHGDAYSYEHCPRANIFRARQHLVRDMRSMMALMRYNDWQHDPMSLDDPGNAICARTDLRHKPSRRGFSGGIDTKVADQDMARELAAWAQNGPTHDQQPVFDWASAPEGKFLHMGQPRVWDFGWQHISPPAWVSGVPSMVL